MHGKDKILIILGADVSHPGPGSQLPSIASVVASFDRNACQYAASISVQSSRVEVIENFSEMFLVCMRMRRQKIIDHSQLR